MIETFIATALAVGVFSFIGGFAIGLNKGRALGWCDRYFEEQEQLKARRDSLGRFKKVT